MNQSSYYSDLIDSKPKSEDDVHFKSNYGDSIRLWNMEPNKGGKSNFRCNVSSTEQSNVFSPNVTSTAVKPILKTSNSIKHKRCSSLGQTIRYIDESPQTLFSPLPCPSTPIVYNASTSPSCDCNCCHTSSASNFAPSRLLTSEDISAVGSLSWYNNRAKLNSMRCPYCHCSCDTYSNVLNNLDPETSLLPSLASPEQLSLCDHHDIGHHHDVHKSSGSQLYSSNETADRQSLYSIHMEKDFRYFFQHPYARLLVAYSVIACNFLIFAEDPISHSHTECKLPIAGNVISFVFTKYPPERVWVIIKVMLWLTAILVGMVVGKYVVHHMVLRRILRLKMFRDEEGTWMIMFLSTFISCYIFSLLYNILLMSAYPSPYKYFINSQMGVSNSSFMKAAACGTWLGDFFTAWMVTDMMLQDELYPGWARGLRRFWSKHSQIRIFIFWTGAIGMSTLVIYLVCSDDISWDNLNHNYVNTNELTRALLASSILVMDLLVVMQDWDFPHFVCDLDIKLPGLKQASYTFKIFTFKKSLRLPETFVFHITGKWFNYGIIIAVMMLDLNMWKNQIIYFPPDFGQYTGPDRRVYTVSDSELLEAGNSSLWTYEVRSHVIDPNTNRSYIEEDLVVNSRYFGYPMYVKSLAFLPCAAGFVLFLTLIYLYGRFPPKTDASYGGRLKKRKASSSWRRERRDSRHGYISWRGITRYNEGDSESFRKIADDNSRV